MGTTAGSVGSTLEQRSEWIPMRGRSGKNIRASRRRKVFRTVGKEKDLSIGLVCAAFGLGQVGNRYHRMLKWGIRLCGALKEDVVGRVMQQVSWQSK